MSIATERIVPPLIQIPISGQVYSASEIRDAFENMHSQRSIFQHEAMTFLATHEGCWSWGEIEAHFGWSIGDTLHNSFGGSGSQAKQAGKYPLPFPARHWKSEAGVDYWSMDDSQARRWLILLGS